MLKVRIQGMPGEVAEFADGLERAGVVLGRSAEYVGRDGSRRVRVYLDVDAARPAAAREAAGEGGDGR